MFNFLSILITHKSTQNLIPSSAGIKSKQLVCKDPFFIFKTKTIKIITKETELRSKRCLKHIRIKHLTRAYIKNKFHLNITIGVTSF